MDYHRSHTFMRRDDHENEHEKHSFKEVDFFHGSTCSRGFSEEDDHTISNGIQDGYGEDGNDDGLKLQIDVCYSKLIGMVLNDFKCCYMIYVANLFLIYCKIDRVKASSV